ncbi:MAG: T9SS type A sorting domain-containing protein [Ignavibacteriae bacterium]|nr:T9SS type A sorting domain-containing protein [Ignavibacteriota bacterium]
MTACIGSTVLLRSTNGGFTWVPSDIGLDQQEVKAIAYSPGTGTNGCLIAATLTGAYISTDGGQQWVPTGSPVPSSPLNAAAATDTFLFAGTTGSGVARTSDHGTTWTLCNTGLADTTVTLLAVFDRVLYAACDNAVFRSTNNGATWLAVGPSPAPSTVANLTFIRRDGAPPTVFAYGSGGMYRVDDGEAAWTKIREEGTPPYDIFSSGLAAIDSLLITVSPYVVSTSSDRGATWIPVPVNTFAQELWRDPSGGNADWQTMYTAIDSSLFRSTDKGGTWQKIFTNDERGAIACLFTPETSSLPSSHLLLTGSYPGYTNIASVHRSIDGGTNWKRILTFEGERCISVTGSDSLVFAAAISGMLQAVPGDTVAGVYVSSDAGTSWTKAQWGAPSDSGITDLTLLSGSSGQKILFSGSYDMLFRSTDLGSTWTSSMAGITSHGRKLIRKAGNALYLANNGRVRVEYTNEGDPVSIYDSARVFRSMDEGLSWQDITGNLHATFIRGFDVVSLNGTPSGARLAAVSDDSVFACVDGPGMWQNVTYGSSSDMRFTRGSIIADNDHFYLGIGDLRRLAWTEIPGLTDVGGAPYVPTAFHLDQNYPNPFNPESNIRYQISEYSNVVLAVYDILGREVAVLVNETKAPGTYQVRFDGSSLSSGVYFYRLQTERRVETRKMMLLR